MGIDLLDLALEVLAVDKVGDIVVVVAALLRLLQVRVALGKLAERSK